jgi:hypothetical protein
METLPDEDWKTLFDEYRSEIIDQVIGQYEYLRNLKLPKDSVAYQVDRKRYDDDFWSDVIQCHFNLGYLTADVACQFQLMTGGKHPWPETLLEIKDLIGTNPNFQVSDAVRSTISFHYLRSFSSAAELEDQISALNTIDAKNMKKQPTDMFVVNMADVNRWPWLLDDENGRRLVAHIFTLGCDAKNRKQIATVIGPQLSGFCEALRIRNQ